MRQLNADLSLTGLSSACSWCHQGAEAVPQARAQSYTTTQCPECRRAITLVTIETACKTVRVSRKTMYAWIEKGWARSVQVSSGRSLLCFSSLFTDRTTKKSLIL